MALTADEVRRVAQLARLELSAEEESLFARPLGRVVVYIDQLERFEAAPVGPSRQGESGPVADVPEAGLPTASVLANAPRSLEAFVAVPRVFGDDD
jgi:aspartyl-tRNA(Asn)/glutamyl-tRNA(Gln) amidotransferase subunit C